MPLCHVSKDFARRLHNFDPDLRVRWSDCQGRYRLERKVTRGKPWPPSALEGPDQYEDRKTASEGYILVGLLRANELTERLFIALVNADIWRAGGAAAVSARLDQGDLEAEKLYRLRRAEMLESYARERYRYMNRVRTLPENARHTGRDMSINLGV